MFNKNLIIKNLEMRNWSRYKLCKEAKMAQSTLSDILTGKNSSPKTDTLQKIADALNVSISDFFDDNETDKHELANIKKEDASEFKTKEEATKFLLEHPVIKSSGFDVEKMSEKELIDLSNELLQQLQLLSYKYKK